MLKPEWYFAEQEEGGETVTDAINPDHYTKYTPEPIEVFQAWKLGYVEGNIFKYVLRHAEKGGLQDLNKAQRYLDQLKAQYVQPTLKERYIHAMANEFYPEKDE